MPLWPEGAVESNPWKEEEEEEEEEDKGINNEDRNVSVKIESSYEYKNLNVNIFSVAVEGVMSPRPIKLCRCHCNFLSIIVIKWTDFLQLKSVVKSLKQELADWCLFAQHPPPPPSPRTIYIYNMPTQWFTYLHKLQKVVH
jgi:hypothetical protein